MWGVGEGRNARQNGIISRLPESNQRPYNGCVRQLQSYALPTELSRGILAFSAKNTRWEVNNSDLVQCSLPYLLQVRCSKVDPTDSTVHTRKLTITPLDYSTNLHSHYVTVETPL